MEDGLSEERNAAAGQPGLFAMLVWLAILVGVPMAVASRDGARLSAPGSPAYALRPHSPPPAVEPMELVALDRDQARAFNAAIPFSGLPNPAARPFRFTGPAPALDRATDCLTAAMLYEAGDDATGQRAVAQVILNRLRHPAFPKTVCAVVFQGSERRTGCQFTFTCDGALARILPVDAWQRARALAKKALSGAVFAKVGYATHYHTDWVVPYWSSSLDKITAVDTHLFFRWTGWWGTPPAFRRTVSGDEPVIPLLARLSPAHATEGVPLLMPNPAGAIALASAPLRSFGADALGKAFGGARLIAMDPTGNAFVLALDQQLLPDAWSALADTFCGGRVQCRILAWRDPAKPANAFPVDPALLPSMAFSYIHDSETGLQRALWNCRDYPRAAPLDCMRDRDPLPVPGPLSGPLSGAVSAPVSGQASVPATSAPASTAPAPTPPPAVAPTRPERRGIERVVITPPGTSPAAVP